MSDRRNFDRATRVAIVKRATRPDGQQACEQCGAVGCKLEVHHVEQDAMQTPEAKQARKLTAIDGQLLCAPCHDAISAKQAGELAKVLAIEARHLGADKSRSPMRKAAKEPRAPLVTAPGQPGWARRFR